MIEFSLIPGISENFGSLLLKLQLSGGCLLFCLLFCSFLFSSIISHQSVLQYFISGEVDYQTIIRVPTVCFIFYQYQLLLLQYHHVLFLHLSNRYAS